MKLDLPPPKREGAVTQDPPGDAAARGNRQRKVDCDVHGRDLMGTSTRKRQGKKPANLNDLPAKAKRAKEVKGGMDPLRLLASVSVQQAQAKDEPAA